MTPTRYTRRMDMSPELSAILVQAIVLIGQLFRAGRRARAIERRVRDIQATVRSLPCLYPRSEPPKTTRPLQSDLQRPPTREYDCPTGL